LNSKKNNKGNVFQEIADFWSFQLNNEIYLRNHPEVERGSEEYFKIILNARKKFIYYFPLMLSFLKKSPSKNFLEIGCGMGTDCLVFANEDFHVTGVDLAPAHLDLANKLFDHYNLAGAFMEANAEKLPFHDRKFGCIYSFGVLHHTPNTEKAIKEVHRVLTDEGRAVIMLYNKWSLNNLAHWITGKGFESVKDDRDTPITYRFSKRAVKKMCSDFRSCNIHTEYLYGAGWGRVYDMTPRLLYRFLSKLLGWHLVIYLQK
jgi:ubiquinone/menaquinone biosynthesis C-methylase UbiE